MPIWLSHKLIRFGKVRGGEAWSTHDVCMLAHAFCVFLFRQSPAVDRTLSTYHVPRQLGELIPSCCHKGLRIYSERQCPDDILGYMSFMLESTNLRMLNFHHGARSLYL